MTSSRLFAVAGAVAMACAGCGEPPECAAPIHVAIGAPAEVEDADPAQPGAQTTLAVASSLAPGEALSLELADQTYDAVADADGSARFVVTVPAAGATARAIAIGRCGVGLAEVALTVAEPPPPDVDAVALTVVAPPIACGAQIGPVADIDAGTPGVQLLARVTAPGATARAVELAGTSYDATTDVAVTLSPGDNTLVGVALDAAGGRHATPACAITLADLALAFSAPAADGRVTAADGVVDRGTLTFKLCGTVGRINAPVALSIDGGPPLATQVTQRTWCRTVTLAASPSAHAITATSQEAGSFGRATLSLVVEL